MVYSLLQKQFMFLQLMKIHRKSQDVYKTGQSCKNAEYEAMIFYNQCDLVNQFIISGFVII